MPTTPTANTLFYGDNLDILRDHIADDSVDLIYLDPPFNSNASYNVLFKSPTGEQSAAQIEAFDDTWHWNLSAERAFDEVVQSGNSDAANMLIAMDLITTLEHENAKMGVFLTLAPPTKPMIARAASAGFYKTEWGEYPKVQIITIADLFEGKRPHMPWLDANAFKKAKVESAPVNQGQLDL